MAELNAANERNRTCEAAVVAYVLNDCGWREEKGLTSDRAFGASEFAVVKFPDLARWAQ